MPTAAVNSAAAALTPPRRRLVFDRRYGWVLDEWKEPSEEALSGGRGMFCILPLAQALLQKASETEFLKQSSVCGMTLVVTATVAPFYAETAGRPIPIAVNFVGSSTLNALQRPEMFSPKAVGATLNNQMHKVVSSVKNADLVSMAPRRINTKESTSFSSDIPEGNTNTESNVD